MAKKKDEVSEEYTGDPITSLDADFFNDLAKDTGFVIAKSGSLMAARPKVRTPLYVINCIYGGGIPLGIISEISGPPSSGKSTFSYQCMANYQKDFPDGVPVIYDMESSMDDIRLQVLGVNTDKTLRLPANSLEEAFSSMFKMFNRIEEAQKRVPNISTFQIYDTIATGGTEKQHNKAASGESVFGAGSMMEAPRIIKQNLANVFPYLEKYPIFLGLLNQVFTQGIGSYVVSVGSGGGYGLKHSAHSHIAFGSNKDVYEEGFLIGTESMVKLEKSKLSPKLVDIPCYIDATQGGRIDEVDSFVRYLTKSNINIITTGSWYKMDDTIDKLIAEYPELDTKDVRDLKGNIRKNDLYARIHEDEDLCKLLQIRLISFINNIYPMQAAVNQGYKEQLISECKYFHPKTDVDALKDALGLGNVVTTPEADTE